jgi:hypothetical protein
MMEESTAKNRADMEEGICRLRPGIGSRGSSREPIHPAWRSFIRYCAELQNGEIELLKIQDGLPVLAEVVKKKIKFAL